MCVARCSEYLPGGHVDVCIGQVFRVLARWVCLMCVCYQVFRIPAWWSCLMCVCCQVFRIPAGGTEPDLMLGERFVHNEDAAHFCKPTDVAILASGDFFISDG